MINASPLLQTPPEPISTRYAPQLAQLLRLHRAMLILLAVLAPLSIVAVVKLSVTDLAADHRLAPSFAIMHGYKLYYPPESGPVLSTLYAGLVWLIDPIERAASHIHADAPALGFAALATFFVLRQRHTFVTYENALLAGVFTALSIFSKQNMAPMVVGLAAWLAVSAGRKSFYRLRYMRQPRNRGDNDPLVGDCSSLLLQLCVHAAASAV